DGSGHVRTEVGFGAEGFLTDATTGEFRDEAVPFFQRQDYGGGIELMTLRIAERFAGEFKFQIDSTFQPPAPPVRRSAARRSGGGISPLVYFVILFIVLSLLGGGRRRGG